MTYFANKHAHSLQAIDAWIDAEHPGAIRAAPDQLALHGLGKEFTGWLIPVRAGVQLLFAVDQSFPFSRPKTAVTGLGEIALSPHVEQHDRLCTWGDAATFDPDAPDQIARGYIVASLRLLEENEVGGDVADYIIDFEAYWRRHATSEFKLLSMVAAKAPSRLLAGWYGENQIVLGETTDDCARWLRHRHNDNLKPSIGRAALIWVEPLPYPADYPDTPLALRSLLSARVGPAVPLFDKVLASTEGRRAILLAGPATSSRSAVGGIIIQDPPPRQSFGPATSTNRGFRRGKTPPTILAARLTMERVNPDDVEASWTRLEPGVFEKLRTRKVAVIGCGAVGATVARMLAQTGVGRLVLIDPDVLKWENIGRHELGGDYVGKYKATAMASRLSASIPHLIECTTHTCDWIDLARERESVFDDCDLILSAMGDWLGETALDDFTRSRGLAASVVYGWLERRAMAAHALALNKDTACFKCGFDSVGEPLLPATSWLKEDDNERCAAPTSPFGATELSFANGLISGLVIDLLLERAVAPAHRVWLGRTAELERQGGYWSQTWKDGVGDPGAGSMMLGADWPQRTGCICA